MKKIEELDLKNKKVVLRCDYNVPLKNGVILDDAKIIKSIPTIKYLIKNNCRVVILSHFGRIKEVNDKQNNSLKIIGQKLSDLLNRKVTFINNCYGEDVKELVDKTSNGDIILLENTRFMDLDNNKESNNDDELSKFWASLGEVFINDAFGSCHRNHASTAGIAKYLPSAIGLLCEEEINNLDPLINVVDRPFTIFMGGAKVEDKLLIMKNLLPKCDYLLLGGGILNTFIKVKGADIKDSLASNDENTLNEVKDLIKMYPDKIIFSTEVVWNNNQIVDINVDKYEEYINKSKLIFVNGTPGKYEEYPEGTKKLFSLLSLANAKVIVGGGDSASAVKELGYENKFNFVSSGGGATLEYIAEGTLPVFEELK